MRIGAPRLSSALALQCRKAWRPMCFVQLIRWAVFGSHVEKYVDATKAYLLGIRPVFAWCPFLVQYLVDAVALMER
jgi:hypothetical protein